MKIITFFNNNGGVGKTTMVYHIAWMLSELGKKVLAVDLDPQSNLSSMFLTNERLEEVFDDDKHDTILDAIMPVAEGESYKPVHIEKISDNIGLLIGNLALSTFEDKLSDAWLKCLSADVYAFRLTSIFKTIIDESALRWNADIVIIDVGPNLGAMNRAVLICSDYVIIPVASDLFSLQGIKNLGTTFSEWRIGWQDRIGRNPKPDSLKVPDGKMHPVGYIVMQYAAKESRPVKSYLRWADKIPNVYERYMLDISVPSNKTIENDVNCLGLLKHYYSLAPMSMEAHKPIFLLKPANGAIGAHVQAVQRSYLDFQRLTLKILSACP